jgi:hypothetical protein
LITPVTLFAVPSVPVSVTRAVQVVGKMMGALFAMPAPKQRRLGRSVRSGVFLTGCYENPANWMYADRQLVLSSGHADEHVQESMMSDAFRRGFLYGIASRGLTPGGFGQLVIEKKAKHQRVRQAGRWPPRWAIPLAAGILGGAGAAYATRPDYEASIKP